MKLGFYEEIKMDHTKIDKLQETISMLINQFEEETGLTIEDFYKYKSKVDGKITIFLKVIDYTT